VHDGSCDRAPPRPRVLGAMREKCPKMPSRVKIRGRSDGGTRPCECGDGSAGAPTARTACAQGTTPPRGKMQPLGSGVPPRSRSGPNSPLRHPSRVNTPEECPVPRINANRKSPSPRRGLQSFKETPACCPAGADWQTCPETPRKGRCRTSGVGKASAARGRPITWWRRSGISCHR